MKKYTWLGDRLFFLDIENNQQWIEVPYNEIIESVEEKNEHTLCIHCAVSKYRLTDYRNPKVSCLINYKDINRTPWSWNNTIGGKITYDRLQGGITITQSATKTIIEIPRE